MTWRGTTTVSDRIFACLPYLLPLIEGLAFGSFLFQQFPVFQYIFVPLIPVIAIYGALGPFGGIIIFFALYFGVVRNERIAHFIRFNTMQAILIDIVLILCGLIVPILAKGIQITFIVETIYNVIFLGVLASVIYSVVQSLLGRYAEIPTISEAVHMQVR